MEFHVDPLPIECRPWKTGTQIPGWEQHLYRFRNGYGASVIRNPYSHGGLKGQYELAVIRFTGNDWRITYETPVADDVIGYLTVPGVAQVLARIAALPGKETRKDHGQEGPAP